MPKSRIMIQLEPETIEQVDKIRGAVPRAAWVRLLIEDWLRGGVNLRLPARAGCCGDYWLDYPVVCDDCPMLGKPKDGVFTEVSVERAREGRAAEERIVRDQASVSQLEENRSPKPGDERSNRSRRAGKGSPAAQGSRVQGVTRTTTDRTASERSRPESPSRPIKAPFRPGRLSGPGDLPQGSGLVRCVCGGVILQDGPKAGKCTKCAKPKEAK